MKDEYADVPMLGHVPAGAKKIGEHGEFDVYEYETSVFKGRGKYPSSRSNSDDLTFEWLEGVCANLNANYDRGIFSEEEEEALEVLKKRNHIPVEDTNNTFGRVVFDRYSIPQFDESKEPESVRLAVDILECVMIIRAAIENPTAFTPSFIATQGAILGERRVLLDLKPLESTFRGGVKATKSIKEARDEKSKKADERAVLHANAYQAAARQNPKLTHHALCDKVAKKLGVSITTVDGHVNRDGTPKRGGKD